MEINVGCFSGYCFAAVLLPLLATATKNAIDIMDQSPSMFDTLHENCEHVQDAFSNIHGLELFGDRISPIKHLQMSTKFSANYCYNDRQKIKKIMQQIVDSVSCVSKITIFRMLTFD